jgi:hypothetical protein
MNSLIIILFEKTEPDFCPFDLYKIIVSGDFNKDSFDELEDSFCSYIEDIGIENNQCGDAIEAVLNQSGFEWKYVGDAIPECQHSFELKI